MKSNQIGSVNRFSVAQINGIEAKNGQFVLLCKKDCCRWRCWCCSHFAITLAHNVVFVVSVENKNNIKLQKEKEEKKKRKTYMWMKLTVNYKCTLVCPVSLCYCCLISNKLRFYGTDNIFATISRSHSLLLTHTPHMNKSVCVRKRERVCVCCIYRVICFVRLFG